MATLSAYTIKELQNLLPNLTKEEAEEARHAISQKQHNDNLYKNAPSTHPLWTGNNVRF